MPCPWEPPRALVCLVFASVGSRAPMGKRCRRFPFCGRDGNRPVGAGLLGPAGRRPGRETMSVKAVLAVTAMLSIAVGFALPNGHKAEAQPTPQVQTLELGH